MVGRLIIRTIHTDLYAVSVLKHRQIVWDMSLVAFPDPVQCFCGAMAVEVERFFKYFNSAISVQTITRISLTLVQTFTI